MKKNRSDYLILIFAIGFLFPQCGKKSDVTVIKLAHALDINHPVHKAMEFMANRLDERSQGQMKIQIFPNGQLGSERELIELLQIGMISITKVSSATLENFVPSAKLYSMPYIFRDHDHFWNVLLGEVGKKILLDCEKYWIRGLGYYDAGSRSFYTKDHPILKPDDLRGLKVRVMKSQTAVQTIRALGGSATPIVWGELYSALQQGVVDAAENNPPSFYFSRHYENCKYYSLDEHTSPPDVVIISSYAWSKLDKKQQQLLQEVMDESTTFQRKLWKETEEEVVEELRKAGITILNPDKEPFRNVVTSLYEQYKGTAFYQLIEQVRNIK